MKRVIQAILPYVLISGIIFLFGSCSAPEVAETESYTVVSPDGKIRVEVNIGNKIMLELCWKIGTIIALYLKKVKACG